MKTKVLIVDDDRQTCEMIQAVLASAGMDASYVTDSRVAAARLHAEKMDLLFLDLHMPGVSGLEVIKQARVMQAGGPRTPIVVLSDLDHAWAEVFVDEPQVPRLKLGQPATVYTDAGDGLPGTISFISSKAEFTPRNVQTAEDRSKLVYRVKIAVDNRDGVLKQGMPVEAEIPLE